MAGSYDYVATNFFIDTAPNILDYIETIVHVLKEDGVWVNHGPLQWHADDALQLTLDELMVVLGDYGLEVEDTQTSLTYYSSGRTDETCMRPDLYQPVLFKARKRGRPRGVAGL